MMSARLLLPAIFFAACAAPNPRAVSTDELVDLKSRIRCQRPAHESRLRTRTPGEEQDPETVLPNSQCQQGLVVVLREFAVPGYHGDPQQTWPGAQGRRQYLERLQLAIGAESKVRLNEDSIPLFDAHDDTAVLEAPAAQTNLKARRPACEGRTLESGVDNLHIVRGLVRTQPQYVNRNTVIGGDRG